VVLLRPVVNVDGLLVRVCKCVESQRIMVYCLIMGRPRLDLSGRRFGRFVVVKMIGLSKKRATIWLCLCDCGQKKRVLGSNLTRNTIKSCGCYRRDLRTIHGQAHRSKGITPEYRAYRGAKDRCRRKTYWLWHRYGGRGIQFRFKSFAEFFKELGTRPSPKHSLDRINNDGHYEAGNVRWATALQQRHNRSDYIKLSPVP
jgi:hypothetical protein